MFLIHSDLPSIVYLFKRLEIPASQVFLGANTQLHGTSLAVLFFLAGATTLRRLTSCTVKVGKGAQCTRNGTSSLIMFSQDSCKI